MYVCVCNGVTDHQIRDAVSEGAGSLHELRTALGVASCCGRCADCAQEIIEESVLLPTAMQSLQAV